MPLRSTTRWRFEPCLPLSVGFLPVFWPPPGAGTLAESNDALSRSISSALPSRSSKIRCSSSHTPASCHSSRRRRQVMPEPHPISWGNISQGMPLFKTNSMPVRAAPRSSTRGLPPLGLGGSSGSSGSITSHNSSVTSFLAIPSAYPPNGFVRRCKVGEIGASPLRGRSKGMRRAILVLTVMATTLAVASAVALAVTVLATEGPDDLAGGAGDDSILSLGGNDVMDGGSGDDFMEGDSGNDFVYGNVGSDRITGGTGDDILADGETAGGAYDVLKGEAGEVVLAPLNNTAGATTSNLAD